MATTPRFTDVQDELLRAIEDAQDASFRFASLMTEQLQQLPSPVQAIETGFGFAARALELQRRYALGLVGAATPRPAGSAD